MKMLEWVGMAHFPGHPHAPSTVYISVMILPTVYVHPFCCCQTDGHEELKKMRRKSKQWMKQNWSLDANRAGFEKHNADTLHLCSFIMLWSSFALH
jgi:hypothetical protein